MLVGLTNPANFKSAGLPPVRFEWTTALSEVRTSFVKLDRACINLVPLERIPLIDDRNSPAWWGTLPDEGAYAYVRRHVLGALVNGTVAGLEGYQWVAQGQYAPVVLRYDEAAASKLVVQHMRDRDYVTGRV